MRVNKIDNTNFMALKIHPKAVTKLKEEPVQTIKRLAELKEKVKDVDNPTVQYIRMLIECELKKAENTNTQKATEEKIAEKIQERKDELIDSLIKECSYDGSALPGAMTGPGFYTRFGANYSTRLYWHNL